MKTKITSILSLFMALSMCLVMASCGEEEASKSKDDDAASKSQSEVVSQGDESKSDEASSAVSEAEPTLVGTWNGTLDFSEFFNSTLNTTMGLMMESDTEYFNITGFAFSGVFTFTEDTCSLTFDEASLDTAKDNIRSAISDGYTLFLADFIASLGLEMTTEEYLEMSGMTMDETVDVAMDEMDFTDLEYNEGKYKVDGNKLYISDSLDEEIDENEYATFELTADTLTITSISMEDAEIEVGEMQELYNSMFPWVFTKA